MDPNIQSRLDDLFDEALAMEPDAWPSFLSRVSSTEPNLAEELAALLARVEQANDFLEQSAAGFRNRLLASAMAQYEESGASAPEHLGEILGAYRIEAEIARGLRSVVYEASRVDEDWSQRVAIKVLTRGFDSDDVWRRFLAERQILTVLRHPQIATLLDGGVTADGAPFFVMELIDGLPVTDYCRRRDLSLTERVQLCRDICNAVAFAHRHLVVHRDLKPSNILVTQSGAVKLLDFGIAKILTPGEELGLDLMKTAQTIEFTRPMTPRYASPEQLAGEPVTSATDVYQLGLVFTEMLTGSEDARNALRIAPDGEPSCSPSQIAPSADAAPPYRRRRLRGDLDGILLKALEPSADARYGSAAGLELDLDNYLESRPVRARQAKPTYVLRKFMRRRPALATGLGLGLAAMLAFVVTLAEFNRQLKNEREAAMTAATRAEEVKDLLVEFIQSPDPFAGDGVDARVSDVLAGSEDVITRQLSGRPKLQVELYTILADVYQNLSFHEHAIDLRQRELTLRDRLGQDGTIDMLEARRKLAQSRMAMGKTETALAEFESVRSTLVSDYPGRWQERAQVELDIGQYQRVYGNAEASLAHFETGIDLLKQHRGEDILLAEALTEYSIALDVLRRYSLAEDILGQALDIYVNSYGPDHLATLGVQLRVAANLSNQGRPKESIAIYEKLLPALADKLGPKHDTVMSTLNNYGFSLDQAGRLEDATRVYEDVLERRREKFGSQHRAVADSLQNLGSLLRRLDRQQQAIELLEEAAAIYAEVNEPGQPLTAYPHVSLAIIYSELGDIDQQGQHAQAAVDLLEPNVPKNHPALLRSQCLLGHALALEGRAEEGVRLMQSALAGLEAHANRFGSHLKACRESLSDIEGIPLDS
jgi:serine/threonine-protein kinase